jgi:hypothetical protein
MVLSLICCQQGQAQPAVCGGDYVCTADDPDAALKWAKKPGAVQLQCADAPVEVIAPSDDERRLACSAATHALQLLGRCGISLRRPLLVEIKSEVRHPFNGAILGLFDTKKERVLITHEANTPALIKGTTAAKLPPRDFYRSLIVHEVVHGVMHQNLKRSLASHAEAEYPAYALQIESLPADVRDRFLQSFDQTAAKAETFLFNDIILSGDPFFFAASAYWHFNALGNGCGNLRSLLAGEARFVAELPAWW